MTQTIKATKNDETIKFQMNYRTLKTRIVDKTGARTVPQSVAMQMLNALPEAGWLCK